MDICNPQLCNLQAYLQTRYSQFLPSEKESKMVNLFGCCKINKANSLRRQETNLALLLRGIS